MNRDEVKIGMVSLGIGIVYLGVKGVCSWLTNRSLSQGHVGKLSQNIEIYSYKDNPKKWPVLNVPEKCKVFDLVPAYFRIHNQSDERIVLETPTAKIVCKLDPAVDLRLNTCTLFKCKPSVDRNYNGVLNHPTQLGIILQSGQQVIINGYLDKNDVFHVLQLSNYRIEEYKRVIVGQKMKQAGFWLFWIISFGGLAILFQQYKE